MNEDSADTEDLKVVNRRHISTTVEVSIKTKVGRVSTITIVLITIINMSRGGTYGTDDILDHN